MPDLQALLDQIDRLDKEATQAPWKSHFGGNPHDEWLSVEPEKGSRTICTVTDDHHPNAEFIALARTALPAMSKALRAVTDLEDESLDGDLQGYEIDQYIGHNQALQSVREAITGALEDNDA